MQISGKELGLESLGITEIDQIYRNLSKSEAWKITENMKIIKNRLKSSKIDRLLVELRSLLENLRPPPNHILLIFFFFRC